MRTIPPLPPSMQRRMQTLAPLSYSQESMWFLQELDPQDNAYNTNYLYRFSGGIDQIALERALNELVHRHEPLRTIYPDQDGRPVQEIQPFRPFRLNFVDMSGAQEEEKAQSVQRYVAEHGEQPYDLRNGPTFRAALLHTAPEENYLFFGIHHIASDAWSRDVFLNELLELYKAFKSGKEPSLPEAPIQYADYAIWQREWLSGDTLRLFVEHWKEILSGELPILDLPTDHPRPARQTYRAAVQRLEIPPSLSARINEFCRKERLTLFQFFMATYAILLMKYTGQEDIIIGCPFANRSVPELDGLIGLFVNTLPIRLNVAGQSTAREVLNQVRTAMLDALTWQAMPFEALVSEIAPERDLSHTPVFQAAINMSNVQRQPRVIIDGLKVEKFHRDNIPAPFEIGLVIDSEGGLPAVAFQYNTDLYDEKTIIRMAAHYHNLIDELTTKTDSPILELEMLTPSEWKRIAVEWNNTARIYPKWCGLHEIFEEQAKHNPDNLAVVYEEKYISYRQLDTLANRLAHHLQKHGVGPEKLVAISMDRSAEIIIAILGIFKAGGAYVPIDPTLPMERKGLILEETEAEIILVNNGHEQDLPENIKTIIQMDPGWEGTIPLDDDKPANLAGADSLAYVIYTSGSTGRPKGALITQRGLVNLAEAQKEVFHVQPEDRVLQFSSLNFDASIGEITLALGSGAAIVLASNAAILPGPDLFSFLTNKAITHLTIPPSSLANVPEGRLPALKMLAVAGEICPPELVERWKQVPNLYNLYGTTEATVWSSAAKLQPDGQKPTIGYPIPNVQIHILDKHLKRVPPGVRGELVIAGTGVGRGYLKRDELTAKHFIPDPFSAGTEAKAYCTGDLARYKSNGEIEILGRVDDQVKIRGFRIELGEIEHTLKQHPGVQDAIVIVREDKPDDKKLVGYVIPSTGSVPDQANLRDYLKSKLPSYMVPSGFVFMQAFPLTTSGKIDRRALPHQDSPIEMDGYLAPRNSIESRLVSIWQEELGIERVGVRDDFFEIGGHSLLAIRLLNHIQKEFNQSPPVSLLFQEGTVEAIAKTLHDTNQSKAAQENAPRKSKSSEMPLIIISPGNYIRELVLALAVERPIYGLYPYVNGKRIYRESVQNIAKILYKNLIHFFPEGPYSLIGHSAHGYYSLELARLIIQNGQKVAFLGLLDTIPPREVSKEGTPAADPDHHEEEVNMKMIFPATERQGSSRMTPLPRLDRPENILMTKVRFHQNNLRGMNLRESVQYIKQLIGRRFPLQKKQYREELEAEHEKIIASMRQLAHTYRPKPFDGQVTLFSTFFNKKDITPNPHKAWTEIITGQLNIVPVPGDHMSMLKSPHVAVLAEKIKALLPHNESD